MLPPQVSSDSDSALVKGTEGSSALILTSSLSPLSSSPSPLSSSSSRNMNKPSMPSMPLISSTSTSPPTTGNYSSHPSYPPAIIDLNNDHASRFQGEVESRVGARVRRNSLDPLDSPPPASLFPSSPSSSYPYPYAPPSRPSSATAFLTRSEVGFNLNPDNGPARPVLSGQLESGSLRGQQGRVRGLDLGVGSGGGGGRGRPMMNMVRVPSEETRVLARAQQQQRRSLHAPHSTRPLVVLYRLDTDIEALVPPSLPFRNGNGNGRGRGSGSGSGSSMLTPAMDRMTGSGSGSSSMRSMSSRHSVMSGDSRLPLITATATAEYEYEYDVHPHLHLHPHQQLVAYASEVDALIDGDEDDGEDDDWLHDPRVSFYAGQGEGEGEKKRKTGYVEDGMSYRGIGNYFMIWLILLGLVALFVFYPVIGDS
ncbi:hypothetical protein F5050DRAFT_1803913 [Lentinula boryana]|uniref:Uncharacterized protein n=1 Tax=Lentinula boryana TaxID=40481 RepID=A0ABQ8QQF2_9AGAR|nr:hypothetical protein F5050DRAFT_1803913 [Lentinula boryana]